MAHFARLGNVVLILQRLTLCIAWFCSASMSAVAQDIHDELLKDRRIEGLQEEENVNDRDLSDPNAAKFDKWEPLVDDPEFSFHGDAPSCSPRSWFCDLGFRHSSTHGRNVGRGKPLTNSSWINRPYHVDWFLGQLLSDGLINNRVDQENAIFSGLRLGWDFDYYWGLEWRFGWADPDLAFNTPLTDPNSGSFFISDIDLVYYPWGDSKIRPYCLLGTGLTRLRFRDENSVNHDSALLTMPYGAGIQFPQWPWLIWRLEVLNNLAFGADSISTMSNVSFTVGMEWRIGARPASYWPWRSSRYIW